MAVRMLKKTYLFAFATLLTLTSCSDPGPEKLTYQVVSTYPHDTQAYTQGLQLTDDHRLFESTGQYGESSLRELELSTGKVLRNHPLAKNIFAEGLTIIGKEIWMLTWKENTAYVFEKDTFKPIRDHAYKGEGWGLTHDGKQLIMSDGSSTLKFINPQDFSIQKTLEVKDGDLSINQLNELEWVNGAIYANIYLTDRIARISPESGKVTGWLDLSKLRNQLSVPGRAEVLNGIAYDKASGHLLVTGKYWSEMYKIKPAANGPAF